MSDLRCPHCEYELRGIVRAGDVFQCPECGAVTDLQSIARRVVDRRRRLRTVQLEVTIALAGTGLTVLLAILFDGRPALGAFRRRLEFLLSGGGLTVAATLTVVLFLLATARWPELLRPERLAFAVITTLLFALAPLPIGLAPIVAWLVGFEVWARRGG